MIRIPFDFCLEKAYLLSKCILVLSIAFAFIYTPLAIHSELQSARKDVILEVRSTRNEAKELINSRFDSLQGSVSSWINVVDRRLYSIEKTADKRLGSIETKTVSLASNFSSDFFSRFDKLESDVNGQLTVTNNHIGEVSKSWSNIPSVIGSRFDVQTDCEKNKLCFQNLLTDTLIDVRYTTRDISTTTQLFNSAVPIWTKNTTEITTSFANTSKNIDRLTKPRWYDRLLGYTLNGAILYRQINPGINVVTEVVKTNSSVP